MLQVPNDDFKLSFTVRRWNTLCKSKIESKNIFEAFQDKMDKEAKAAGKIFCEPLNGDLVEFPETFEELEYIIDFQIKMLSIINSPQISITLNAKSFTTVQDDTNLSQFNGRSTDLFDIKTSKLIKPTKEVLGYLTAKPKLYQTKEELCYILTTTVKDNTTEILSNSSLTVDFCDGFGPWWTLCQFQKPVFVSLAGLCNDSPIDKIYSLIEPKQDKKERFGTFVGTTGWVLDYDMSV